MNKKLNRKQELTERAIQVKENIIRKKASKVWNSTCVYGDQKKQKKENPVLLEHKSLDGAMCTLKNLCLLSENWQ